MLTLYDFRDSGNGYKVRLVLAHLGIAYERVERDITKGETRTPEFLALNPDGRIPMLCLDNGTYLAQSDAIIWYLAEDTGLAPHGRLARAQTLQWMFFEQYSHEPYVAVPRFWRHSFGTLTLAQESELASRMEKGYVALGVMEKHLAHHLFFVDERFGLADIALYAYTHCAGEGGFNLDNFPQVNAWLARVAAQAGHVTIDHGT
jgi:glutathione S-transferase